MLCPGPGRVLVESTLSIGHTSSVSYVTQGPCPVLLDFLECARDAVRCQRQEPSRLFDFVTFYIASSCLSIRFCFIIVGERKSMDEAPNRDGFVTSRQMFQFSVLDSVYSSLWKNNWNVLKTGLNYFL